MFKKLRFVFIALLLFVVPVSAANDILTTPQPEKVTIQLVHTNDMHGNISGSGQMLNFSTWYDQFKKDNPNTLLIDAGDAIQGTPVVNRTNGALMIDVMNEVGYDIVTLGNHEFDFGKEALDSNVKKYNATLLQSNIKDAKTGKWQFKRYEIKEFDGVKVGFFALIGLDAAVKSDPTVMKNYKIEDPIKVGKEMVKFLEPKVDVIVAITHLGVSDEGYDNAKDLSEKVPGINVIIDAHSHTSCPSASCFNEGFSLISQSEGNFSNGIRYVTITVEPKRKSFTTTKVAGTQLAKFAQNPAVKAIFDKENDIFKEYGSQVIGSSSVELRAARNKPYDSVRTYESNVANLVADAYLHEGKTDLAVINGGNVRISIPAGDITREQILKLHPFSNAVVIANITGKTLLEVFEHSVGIFPNENGGFLHIAGGTLKFDSTKPAGSRVTELMIGGKPVDPAKTYSVAIPDFTLKGGDGYKMLAGIPYTRTLGKVDSEIVMSYIESLKTVAPKIEGRIIDIAKK